MSLSAAAGLSGSCSEVFCAGLPAIAAVADAGETGMVSTGAGGGEVDGGVGAVDGDEGTLGVVGRTVMLRGDGVENTCALLLTAVLCGGVVGMVTSIAGKS